MRQTEVVALEPIVEGMGLVLHRGRITLGAGEASGVMPIRRMLKGSMTQIIEWLNQHYIIVGAVIGTVVILIVASVAMLVVNRLLRHCLVYLQGRLHQSDETNLIISRIVTAVLWAVTALSLSIRGV